MSAVLQPTGVQTSAPGLFGPAPDLSAGPAANDTLRATCGLVFTGTLLHKPHVASLPCDGEGHMVPVLVLELAHVGAGHHHLRAHVPFTAATRGQAEQLARRLQRHQVVTVTTSLTDVRLFLPAASLSHHDDSQP